MMKKSLYLTAILVACIFWFHKPAEASSLSRGTWEGDDYPIIKDPGRVQSAGERSLLLAKGGLQWRQTDSSEWYYYSNQQLQTFLHNYVKRCGHISRLYSIGESVSGFPLWVLEITDSPHAEEAEPAFKYVGNMHGDEPLGRQLLVYLANWLCDNYLRDPQATLIVKNTHLHLLPALNPDGFARNSRSNLRHVDLNRAFPDQFFAINNNESLLEPEVQALMRWSLATKFVASASCHEGALVANYPWDGSADQQSVYSKCPDDDTFKHLARAYASAHPTMWNSTEFKSGVTNGAAWYAVYGGMQDWNYIHAGCMDITIEMNDDKWPPASQLRELWEQHRPAMLALAALPAKTGLHGKVTSAATGKPLAATVSIAGIDYNITARASLGDFYRLLTPGTYQVTVSMEGHISATTPAMVLPSAPTGLDFILEESAPPFSGAIAKGPLLRGASAQRGGDSARGGRARMPGGRMSGGKKPGGGGVEGMEALVVVSSGEGEGEKEEEEQRRLSVPWRQRGPSGDHLTTAIDSQERGGAGGQQGGRRGTERKEGRKGQRQEDRESPREGLREGPRGLSVESLSSTGSEYAPFQSLSVVYLSCFGVAFSACALVIFFGGQRRRGRALPLGAVGARKPML